MSGVFKGIRTKIESQLISLYQILAFYMADDTFFPKLNSPFPILQSPEYCPLHYFA